MTTIQPLIATWACEEKTISLLRETSSNRLIYSDGHTTKTFKSTLYDINYALSLVPFFYKTIGLNLKEELHADCFLPKLSMSAHNDNNIQVALFGRVNTRKNPSGMLKGLRWGVFNTFTKEEQSFEVDNTDLANVFIKNAPNTNYPHMESKIDSNGNLSLKPASDHYEMISYIARFSPVLIYDTSNRIKNVALRYISLIDKTIFLDENNGAVTLVSASHSCDNIFTKLFGRIIGHAMVACEGVQNGVPFLHYVHFTRNPHDKNPELKGDEAQIESFNSKKPLATINGPTFKRSMDLVRNIFTFAKEAEKKRFKFAFYGSFFSGPSSTWAAIRMESFHHENRTKVWNELVNNIITSEEPPMTCLSCAYRILGVAGIIFLGSRPFTTPLEKLDIVKSAPIFLIPDGFDHSLLGREFPSEHRQLSNNILSACVILTPNDCPPTDCAKWDWQAILEENAATDREIERINQATTLSELRFQYEPKRW